MSENRSLTDEAKDVLESRNFYEVCQAYRHAQDIEVLPGAMSASERYEELKDWIRENCFVGKRPFTDSGWLDGSSRAFTSTEIKFCPSCEKDWLE